MDTFLTTMESKLRGPFSSLDLAKAVTTNALRGSHTPTQYLQNLSKVLSRTDKVIQSRILIGLLGLDSQEEQVNQEIYKILQQAQQAPTHEKWVRTVAGLIQGIMFEKQSDADSAKATDFAFHRSCRGPEATKLLEDLCDDVCNNVKEGQEDLEDPSNLPDLNASFTPFRYSLLSEELLSPLVPECSATGKNPHFRVNEEAFILKVDEELEANRAKEEMEHQGPILMKTKMSGSTIHGSNANGARDAAAKAATTLPPGFRPTKLVPTSATPAQKAKLASAGSSMFMPKKPNPMLAQRQKQLQQKTMLRRKGAAQSLVNKTKVKNRLATTAAAAPNAVTATTATSRARTTGKFGGGGAAMAGRSKMKLMDVEEANTLTKEHEAREAADANPTAGGRVSKKRRLLEAAATQQTSGNGDGNDTPEKKTKVEAASDTTKETSAAAPAVSAQSTTEAAPTNGQQKEEEWTILLKERSNKLSDEDRQRVQQFFQHRFNPTPEQSVYKMKLHEQRSKDPSTGQAVKETFYLELDYNNFSSKQSKKVKRY